MRNITKFGFLLLLVFGLALTLYAGDKGKAQIKFEKTVYDFGHIKEDGGPVTHNFVFRNVGDQSLKISSARPECGCTTPAFPKDEIAPGATGVIKVTYNPLGRPGGFTKSVTVRCNGNPSKINLKIRGTVVPQN